jgi:hypothetical protein
MRSAALRTKVFTAIASDPATSAGISLDRNLSWIIAAPLNYQAPHVALGAMSGGMDVTAPEILSNADQI